MRRNGGAALVSTGVPTASCLVALLPVVAACGPPASAPTRRAPPEPAPSSLAGGRIVATATGALVSDEDSGALIATDAAGRPVARVQIGAAPGLLVSDPVAGLAFVADRRGDRVVVVETAPTLRVRARWPTPVEPFALALTPDRGTLLVATIADRTLVALDAHTGAERWRVAIAPGARGVAISPRGDLAVVASIATDALEIVELGGAHRVGAVPFERACDHCERGAADARGAGALRFVADRRVVATFQRAVTAARTPAENAFGRMAGRYGAAPRPPVSHHLALLTLDLDGEAPQVAQQVAQIVAHQPRALAWDPAQGSVVIAGLGADALMRVPAGDDPAAIEAGTRTARLALDARCGPDGVAVAADGDLLVWCAFTRVVVRLPSGGPDELARAAILGPVVAASTLPPAAQRGRVLFHAATAIDATGAVACASCHPEGGADGLSWTIDGTRRQTPALAGRLAGTAPYRWDGTAATLAVSLDSTVRRLGGAPLDDDARAALIAYLGALSAPRVPTRDPAAIARGRALFEGRAGCATCHDGAALTDGEAHALVPWLPPIDTPSLVGLAASAPYLHDGSAATLDDVLAGRGSLLDRMADVTALDSAARADLRAYLETR